MNTKKLSHIRRALLTLAVMSEIERYQELTEDLRKINNPEIDSEPIQKMIARNELAIAELNAMLGAI